MSGDYCISFRIKRYDSNFKIFPVPGNNIENLKNNDSIERLVNMGEIKQKLTSFVIKTRDFTGL